MFSTITGGEAAMAAAERLLRKRRRGDLTIPTLAVDQVREQLSLAVNRAMCEAGLYDPEAAATALKQAQGDVVEATYLLRAFRSTLRRLGSAHPVNTSAMLVRRSLSTTKKGPAGGQTLGATYDYTLRLIEFADAESGEVTTAPLDPGIEMADPGAIKLGDTHLHEQGTDDLGNEPFDITRNPVSFPCGRDQRLQILARGDEGFLAALAYSAFRSYGRNHPYLGSLREGLVEIWIDDRELKAPVAIGEVAVTECVTVHKTLSLGKEGNLLPRFTHGYSVVPGHSERKAIAMAIVDRALRSKELGEPLTTPVQDEEFVIPLSDGLDASGIVQHVKLPHYVDYQAEVQSLGELRHGMTQRRDELDGEDP